MKYGISIVSGNECITTEILSFENESAADKALKTLVKEIEKITGAKSRVLDDVCGNPWDVAVDLYTISKRPFSDVADILDFIRENQ